jgi:hypothetical protein
MSNEHNKLFGIAKITEIFAKLRKDKENENSAYMFDLGNWI